VNVPNDNGHWPINNSGFRILGPPRFHDKWIVPKNFWKIYSL